MPHRKGRTDRRAGRCHVRELNDRLGLFFLIDDLFAELKTKIAEIGKIGRQITRNLNGLNTLLDFGRFSSSDHKGEGLG